MFFWIYNLHDANAVKYTKHSTIDKKFEIIIYKYTIIFKTTYEYAQTHTQRYFHIHIWVIKT